MTASQQIALARVAQEAFTNVREHARASRVELTARATSRGVSLVVADDGVGFDLGATVGGGGTKRLGLAGMDERVRLLGGSFTVDSRPGGPTRVTVSVDRKSTRLNSSHANISYAVFCLKKKK